jgi:hypothetical protein
VSLRDSTALGTSSLGAEGTSCESEDAIILGSSYCLSAEICEHYNLLYYFVKILLTIGSFNKL